MVNKNIYHIMAILLIAMSLQAQETGKNIFLSTRAAEKSQTDPVIEKALKNGEIKAYFPMNLDVSGLKSNNNLNMRIKGKEMALKNLKKDIKGKDRFSISGKIGDNDHGYAGFSVMNGAIAGSIYKDGAVYDIYTSKNGKRYLLEIDPSFDCGEVEDIKPVDESPKKMKSISLNQVSTETSATGIPGMEPMSVTSGNCCKMRLIVLFTPAVLARNANIHLTIERAVGFANGFMENSLVYEEWELAYCGLTNYDEYYVDPGDGRFTDLSRFRIDGDGYMDEVHDLRDKYNADVCVLVSECQYYPIGRCGGVASTIDAGISTAFCLVHAESWGGINSNVFSHEIGHLLDGSHDYEDRGYTDISHGYKIVELDKGTVMARSTTLPHWSNPFVEYNGYNTGTLTWNYMAQVLRTEVPEKVRFYQPEVYLTLTADDVADLKIGDAISEYYISTSGNMTVKSGSVLNMRSSNILLNAGFTVESGAEVEMINGSVEGCP